MLILPMVTTVKAANPKIELEARFDEVWNAITNMLSSSDTLQSEVTLLEETISEQSNTITVLETDNSELKTALSELESRVALIEHSPPQGLPAYDSGWIIVPEGGDPLELSHMLDSSELYVYIIGKGGDEYIYRVEEVTCVSYSGNILSLESLPTFYETIRVLIWNLPDTPTGVNNAPVAIARPVNGIEGSPVNLYAIDSYDPDGDVLQYRWDFDNDGVWDEEWSDGDTVFHVYTDDTSGIYRLEVSDGELTASTTGALNIENAMPIPEILGYVSGGNTVTFYADWSDPGDDSWSLMWFFEFDESVVEADYVSVELTPVSYVNALGERELVWSGDQLVVLEKALNPTHEYPGPGDYLVLFAVYDDDIPYGETPGLTEMLITIP